MHHAVVILVAMLQPAGFRAEFIALFEPCSYQYTGGGYVNQEFRYRLLVPEESSEPQPLIVWLHGFGEAGSDNLRQLLWLDKLIYTPPIRRDRFPFFLVAVQCPRDNPYWTTGDQSADDMIDVAKAITDEVVAKYPIDRKRVYLAGVSSGGAGCWALASRHPEFFAAVAPMASTADGGISIEKFEGLPVWAFHSRFDSHTSAGSVRLAVAALQGGGGNAHLTEIDSASHDCWNAAFHEYHLLDWLLSQQRGEQSTPPGTIPLSLRLKDFANGWEWWQALAQIGIPVALIAAAWKALASRRPGRPQVVSK